MAVTFRCKTEVAAKRLFNLFAEAVALGMEEGNVEGSITTWIGQEDGTFTHKAEQHDYEACFAPKIVKSSNVKEDLKYNLVFNIRPDVATPITDKEKRESYAYYHGRLISTFIRHFFQNRFDLAWATPNPAKGDDWK